ncbi:hypothetical protein R3P38DRAFT_2882945 [Favolaschia claudopus]|uniref:Uncharacterized protein n=1 Tax=Favolaschia claudopus TaxID=2862362 RepID=A0AAW0D2S4_9AGAR
MAITGRKAMLLWQLPIGSLRFTLSTISSIPHLLMPVSFAVATHPAKPYVFYSDQDGYTPTEVLSGACNEESQKVGEMLQFSLSDKTDDKSGRDLTTRIPHLIPHRNGFIFTLLTAYTGDHSLIIRPDDIWLTILTQFNFFVNRHAELLRANFVAHTGKRELIIHTAGTRHTIDFADIARQFTGLIEKNVVDPTLREWAAPDFSTTTANDKTVGAVLLMATLKEYFTYVATMWGCGIPRVTLEGTKADYEKILTRLEKLKEYSIETIAWYHLLKPVIVRFVAAFDEPEHPGNVRFWQCIAHHTPGGSGISAFYSGWIGAFAVFSKKGDWIGNRLNLSASLPPNTDPAALTAADFWSHYGSPHMPRDLVLDDTPYHRLPVSMIPPGYGEVDVKLVQGETGEVWESVMVAGVVGTRVCNASGAGVKEGETVTPVRGWWMFVKSEAELAREAKEGGGV